MGEFFDEVLALLLQLLLSVHGLEEKVIPVYKIVHIYPGPLGVAYSTAPEPWGISSTYGVQVHNQLVEGLTPM